MKDSNNNEEVTQLKNAFRQLTNADDKEGWIGFLNNLFEEWLVHYESDKNERDNMLFHVKELKYFVNSLNFDE